MAYNPETGERVCERCELRDTDGDVPLCVQCQLEEEEEPGDSFEDPGGEDWYSWRNRRLDQARRQHTDD